MKNIKTILIVLLLLIIAMNCFSQGKNKMNQKITNINSEMKNWIQTQNDWVRGHFTPENEYKYETADGKINLLQGLLDRKVYNKNNTIELQALGICFGEILIQEMDLHWIQVEDEYGKDPALQYKNTSIIIFPRTIISKRVEKNEEVNIKELLKIAKETQERMIKEGY